MNNAYQAGLLYELRAARYVRRRGYRLLNMRYRARDGEIDLIARDGDTIVFIEVKARPAGKLGAGVAAVTADQASQAAARGGCVPLPQEAARRAVPGLISWSFRAPGFFTWKMPFERMLSEKERVMKKKRLLWIVALAADCCDRPGAGADAARQKERDSSR